MKFIDTHAHLDFPEYDSDRKQVIQRAKKAGVTTILNVGASLTSSTKAIHLAKQYPHIFAAVGVHPEEKEFDLIQLTKLAKQPQVVAIGECGLDYKHGIAKQKQISMLIQHLKLAEKLKLPIIIHNRDAHREILQILEPFKIKGVFHCFSGSLNFLQKIVELGFYVGLGGNITFKNAPELRELVKVAPLDRILLETDSPFLSPEPQRGQRNEPARLLSTAQTVAQIKNLSLEQVAYQTSLNARNLLKLAQ